MFTVSPSPGSCRPRGGLEDCLGNALGAKWSWPNCESRRRFGLFSGKGFEQVVGGASPASTWQTGNLLVKAARAEAKAVLVFALYRHQVGRCSLNSRGNPCKPRQVTW